MYLPIKSIMKEATLQQTSAAKQWTARSLNVQEPFVTRTVAVAYVIQHFTAGQLEGWEGFVADLGS